MRESVFQLLNRHVRVSYETVDKLIIYHDLLLKWHDKINLIGPDTLPDVWIRHFLDSLQLLNHIDNLSDSLIDLGSGAGFPGMALAIAGAGNVHLIESDTKKMAFLDEVARATKTKVSLYRCRIEDQPVDQAKTLVARACAPLDHLLGLAFPYLSHGTICLFHKGKNYYKEIEDANEHWQFQYAALPSVTDSQGAILKITDLRKDQP